MGVGLLLGLLVGYCYARYYLWSGGAAGIGRSLTRTWLHVLLAGGIPFGIFFLSKLFLAAADRLTSGNLFIAEMISTIIWALVIFYLSVKESFGRKAREKEAEENPE